MILALLGCPLPLAHPRAVVGAQEVVGNECTGGLSGNSSSPAQPRASTPEVMPPALLGCCSREALSLTTAFSPVEGRNFPLSLEKEASLAPSPSCRTGLKERMHGTK